MPQEQHEDEEFFGIQPRQTPYELEHFDRRDQMFLTQISILSQQCNLLRSRNFSREEEIAELRESLASMRAELAPLKALHQKLTSIYAFLAMIGAVLLGIVELTKGIKSFLTGK